MSPSIEGGLAFETGEGTLPIFVVNLLDGGSLSREDFEAAAGNLFLGYPANSYLKFVVVSDKMHCFPDDPTDEYAYTYLARLLNVPMEAVQCAGRIGIDNGTHTMWLDEDTFVPRRSPNDFTPTYAEQVIRQALPDFFTFV